MLGRVPLTAVCTDERRHGPGRSEPPQRPTGTEACQGQEGGGERDAPLHGPDDSSFQGCSRRVPRPAQRREASLQQRSGRPAWSSRRGRRSSSGAEKVVDVPFVPILVVEEDPPLNMGKILSWAEKKEAEERRVRELEESMVALDTRARHGLPLTAVEHAAWYAWRFVRQQRARASDPGADRGAVGRAVGRDSGG